MKELHPLQEAVPHAGLPPLEPLEVHSGMVFGHRRTPPSVADVPTKSSGFREVLEELLVPALSRTPCLVAFSGGRDSSAMLAMATDVARRHGFDPPVPITFRIDRHPDTWENEWQEQTVRHLGLHDWEIISVGSELDTLGSIARGALLRHGLYWPANAHSLVPLLKAAGDGALITGNGGDELFVGLVKNKEASIVQMFQRLPLRRALIVASVSVLPTPLKIRVQNQRGLRLPWLRPSARREVMRAFVANSIHRIRSEIHPLERLNDSRYLELARGIMTALARDAGVELYQPFLDGRLFKGILAELPAEGFPSRNAALEAFFGDLLPKAVAKRTTKAVFTEVFWSPESREFARQWDGTGLDHSLIDPDKLKQEWLKPVPDARSNNCLHAAWLASQSPS